MFILPCFSYFLQAYLNLIIMLEKNSLAILIPQLLVGVYSFVSLWDGRREKKELNSMFSPLSFKLTVLHPKFSYFRMISYFKFLCCIRRKLLYCQIFFNTTDMSLHYAYQIKQFQVALVRRVRITLVRPTCCCKYAL